MKREIVGYRLSYWSNDEWQYAEFFKTLEEAESVADKCPFNDGEYTSIEGYYQDNDDNPVYVDLYFIENGFFEEKECK